MTPPHDLDVLLPDEATVRARRGALVGELRGASAGAPRRRFGRRRGFGRRLAVTVVALVAAGTAGAAATGLFSAADLDIRAGIGCYSEPKLDAQAISIVGARPDPVATCTLMWRRGQVTTSRTVPPLVACTSERGPVRVFPSGDPALCARLELRPLPADYAAAGAQALKDGWTLRYLARAERSATPCVSPRARAAQARERVAGVRVRIAGDEPCAGVYDIRRGDVIVTTVSRARAEERYAQQRMERALRRLEPITAPCLPPEARAAQARRRLDAAGLSSVRVRVDGDGPCALAGYGIDGRTPEVTISTVPRADAASNAAGNAPPP